MAFSNIWCDAARNMGRVLGRFFGASGRLRKKRDRPSPEPDQVRSIVADELARLLGAQGTITRAEFEERLRHMVESIFSLQKKIEKLSAHGPVSEAALSEAIASVSASKSLGAEETAVLAGIFRQNIAIQKPELASSLASETAR